MAEVAKKQSNKSMTRLKSDEKLEVIAQVTATGTTKITASTPVVADQVKIQQNVIIHEYGVIEKVFPLDKILYVSVRETPAEDKYPEGDFAFDPPLFNQFGESSDKVNLMQTFIPLDKYIPGEHPGDHTNLIGKKVKVTTVDGNYATKAELTNVDIYSNLLPNGIHPKHVFESVMLPIDESKYLLSLGYTKQQVEDLKAIKASDIPDPTKTVVRLKNEAYWDKDVAGVKNEDYYIAKELPSIIDRNNLQMKTKKCHVPTLFFSAI